MLEAGKCMIKKFLLTVLLILTFSCGAVFASIDNPKFNGLVADEAGMLMPDAEKKINQTLKDIKKKTGITVAIILLKSINGQPIITRHLKLKCLTLKIKNFKFASNLRENF